jgi:predicted  nucleic acid-binding Zn-ribbon protein
MAMPALKFEPEEPVEDRIATLEADVRHIRTDVADTKIDIRRLNDKIDGVEQRLTAKLDEVNQRLTGKIDEVDRRLTDKIASLTLSMEKSFAELKIGRALDRVWWLLMSAALLAVMARGFKWL